MAVGSETLETPVPRCTYSGCSGAQCSLYSCHMGQEFLYVFAPVIITTEDSFPSYGQNFPGRRRVTKKIVLTKAAGRVQITPSHMLSYTHIQPGRKCNYMR